MNAFKMLADQIRSMDITVQMHLNQRISPEFVLSDSQIL